MRRLQRWLDVANTLAASQASLGLIPFSAAEELDRNAHLSFMDPDDLDFVSRDKGPTPKPFFKAWEKIISAESAGYIHYGASESDIQDTTRSIEIKEVFSIIERDLYLIIKELIALARRARKTLTVENTTDEAYQPTTLGLKIAVWLDEMIRNGDRCRESKKRILVGQLFGSGGTMAAYGGHGPELLEEFTKRLKLYAPLTDWHTSRDRLAELLSLMAILAGGLGKIAYDIILLSSRKHCRPVWSAARGNLDCPIKYSDSGSALCEQVTALAKLIKIQAASGFDSLANSRVTMYRGQCLELLAIPESSHLLCRAMSLTITVLRDLKISEDYFSENSGKFSGYTYSGKSFYQDKDMPEQHKHFHELTQQAYASNRTIKDLLEENQEIARQFSSHELNELLRPESHIGMAPKITEKTIVAAEEWLAGFLPEDLSENICPLTDRNGDCSIQSAAA